MNHTPEDDVYRFGFTHVPLSTGSAVAPAVSLASVPQATFEVTTLADVVDASDGVLSLREAIDLANTNPGLDRITFAPSLRGGTIRLDSATELGDLTISDDVVISGDLRNSGAAAITIDGVFESRSTTGITTSGAYYAFRVENAAAHFEDLTIVGAARGIGGWDATVILDRAVIRDNYHDWAQHGAGLSLHGGSASITHSEISSNIAFSGAGIFLTNAELYLSHSTVSDHKGPFAYGIWGSGSITLVESTIGNNVGFEYGTGITLTNGELNIIDSTITNNGPYAESSIGGAIRINGTLNIVNSTLAANLAGTASYHPDLQQEVPPGTIRLDAGSIANLVNTTITGTWMRTYPGTGIVVEVERPGLAINIDPDAQLNVSNTIVTDIILGEIVSNGANIFGDRDVLGARAGDWLGADAAQLFTLTKQIGATAARAGVLADNGGPTQTIALRNDPTNPALDAADPADAPAADQRGFPRDATPDIGAFELGPTTLPPLAEGVPVPNSAINGVPRSALTLTAGEDAAISFVDEVAAFQSSLGVYLVGPDGEIMAPRWVFERIEHALPDDSVDPSVRPGGGPSQPGDTILLSDLYDPQELQEGVEFGLFLVADGAVRNPFIVFDGGTLDFRTAGDPAKVTDVVPQLVHTSETGAERLVLGDIMHTVDAGSPNPLSNKLNPPPEPPFRVGGRGQALSGLLDGQFTIAFEDQPLNFGDRDFNDLLVAVELLDGGDFVPVAAEPAAFSAPAVAELQVLVIEGAET